VAIVCDALVVKDAVWPAVTPAEPPEPPQAASPDAASSVSAASEIRIGTVSAPARQAPPLESMRPSNL
jgi:hypothetical protein